MKLSDTKSDIVLHADYDVAYLTLPNSKSLIAAYYYLSNNTYKSPLNGPIEVDCKTVRRIMNLAAESGTEAFFSATNIIFLYLCILDELGNPQPPTSPKK